VTGTTDIRVRYAETDQMGRAHHRHYLVWCELGRTALMRDSGLSYAALERDGVLLPVARVEIEYRAPVFYDEVVRIHTRVERVRSRSVEFGYRLTRDEDRTTVALARITLASADTDGRPRRLPPPVRDALARLAPPERPSGEESR